MDAGDEPTSAEDAGLGPALEDTADGYAVIPKQNKDVCRACDRATWRHAATGIIFKWCKGCKRFANITKFAGKLHASKCDACRARGRVGYLRRVQKVHEAEATAGSSVAAASGGHPSPAAERLSPTGAAGLAPGEDDDDEEEDF